MNWEAISAIGEIVGSIAVVVTLAYLAVQTRQNSHHTKALLQQGQSDRFATILLTMATPDLANVWITGNGGTATPETVKALQFAELCDMLVYDMMDLHNTHSDGLTSDEQLGSALRRLLIHSTAARHGRVLDNMEKRQNAGMSQIYHLGR